MDDESLVLATIGRSHDTWLAPAAIASGARLPPERVQAVLDASPAVIVEAAPAAQPRYSTRAHYRARTGLVKRYVDALLSS